MSTCQTTCHVTVDIVGNFGMLACVDRMCNGIARLHGGRYVRHAYPETGGVVEQRVYTFRSNAEADAFRADLGGLVLTATAAGTSSEPHAIEHRGSSTAASLSCYAAAAEGQS